MEFLLQKGTNRVYKPQWREVWWFRLSRAVGHEIGAKPGWSGPERPCLVISDNSFNRGRKRVTVVPLTSADNDILSHWSVWVTPSAKLKIHHAGFLDCGQPWTVSVLPPNDPRNDCLGWYCGSLTVAEMVSIEEALLKVLTGEGVPHPRDTKGAPFNEGTVLEVYPSPATISNRCLVVSDTLFEAFRLEAFLRQKDRPDFCTVVPLVPIRFYNREHTRGVAPVNVTQGNPPLRKG